jgi:hypothetical protein
MPKGNWKNPPPPRVEGPDLEPEAPIEYTPEERADVLMKARNDFGDESYRARLIAEIEAAEVATWNRFEAARKAQQRAKERAYMERRAEREALAAGH